MLLAINTASRQTAIALVDDTAQDATQLGRVKAEDSWHSENDEAEKLMPAIDKLLDGKSDGKSVDKVLVIKGPGSFTGLRIGVTAANTIAYLKKIPICAIDTFELLRAQNPKAAADASSALVLFAGKREVYIQSKEGDEPTLLPIEEAKTLLKEKGITKIFGELRDDQEEAFEDPALQKPEKTFGETVASLDLTALAEQKLPIEPLYIKGPGICCT